MTERITHIGKRFVRRFSDSCSVWGLRKIVSMISCIERCTT